MKKWTIGAAQLVGKLMLSCHELGPDAKTVELIRKLMRGENIREIDFFQADKMGLYSNFVKTAEILGKNVIDKEVVIKYFGGRKHEQSALDEAVIDVDNFAPALKKLLLAHILTPLLIVGKNQEGLIGKYENDGKTVGFEGILLFREDETKDFLGKIVLFHYAPVVQAEPGEEIVAYLRDEQKKCAGFMKALADLNGRTIRVGNFSKAIRRNMALMEPEI